MWDLAVLVPITVLVAILATFPLFGPGGAMMAALIAAISSVAVGIPALAFARSRGVRGVFATTLTGGLAGPLPFLVWGLVIVAIDGPRRAWPPSSPFLIFVALAALIGATSGAIYALLHDAKPEAGQARLLAAVCVLGLAVATPLAVARWPADRWPRYREVQETLELSWAFGSAVDEIGTREVRLWRADRPSCVSSVYLPSLTTALAGREPGTLYAEIVRERRIGRGDRVRVLRFGGLAAPSGPGTFLQGCRLW